MKNNANKKGLFSGLIMIASFLLMLFPACKCKANYGTFAGSGTGFSFNGNVGNIYKFIFGSNSLGKYGLDSTGFNFALFLGFMAVIVSVVLGIIYMAKPDATWKFKLAETIASGVAMVFLSPIFSATAVYGFYNSLPDSYRNGSYADYKNFRFGFGFVLLFIFLVVVFAYNLISTIKMKRINSKEA